MLALTIKQTEIDVNTPTGKMRTYVLQPTAPGKYPGVVFYSEIFQARRHPAPRLRSAIPQLTYLSYALRERSGRSQCCRTRPNPNLGATPQVTSPIMRSAQIIASHGFVVAVPEIYHEFEAPGALPLSRPLPPAPAA